MELTIHINAKPNFLPAQPNECQHLKEPFIAISIFQSLKRINCTGLIDSECSKRIVSMVNPSSNLHHPDLTKIQTQDHQKCINGWLFGQSKKGNNFTISIILRKRDTLAC